MNKLFTSKASMVALAVLLLLVMVPSVALANPTTDPGVALSDWLIRNVSGLFTVVLIVGAIVFLVRRELAGFVGFLALAGLVAFVVFAPGSFKCAAIGMANAILGTSASCGG